MSLGTARSDGPEVEIGAPDRQRGTGLARVSRAGGIASHCLAWLTMSHTRLRIVKDLLSKPPVLICLFGDKYCFDVYRSFKAPHPKFPFVGRKSFGVALRDLDGPFETLFSSPRFVYFRRKVRRAEKLGYRVERIDPRCRIEQVMDIHVSTGIRQNRAIRPDYLDRASVATYLSSPGPWYGVLDPEGALRAYCHLPVIGDCCFYSRILGDAKRLDDGIMYLLIHATVGAMHRHRSAHGYPRWVMYDMFLGGLEGLRNFKTRSGFVPERVTWIWERRRVDS
ncbi:MAG TPA: hypothetical protein VN702_22395 [Acetobacteraceae bacterium]|nr:hypothetical protein [Acetobacteraceae bacterium]